MNRIIFFVLGFFLLVAALLTTTERSFAQDAAASPVRWEFAGVKNSGNGYTLVLKATIASGWKLYSVTMPDSLPFTRVELDSTTKAKIQGIEEKGKLESKKEPLFNQAETRYFENDVELHVNVQLGAATAGSAVADGSGQGGRSSNIKGVVRFMAILGDSVIGPLEVPFRFSFTADGRLLAKATGLQESASGANDLKKASIDLKNPVNKCGGTGTEDSKSKSLLGIFILGFLGGLVGLIMPCTFPMIPLTVSFFTKKSSTRSKGIFNAFLYGFFIFIIYVLLSLPFYFLKSSSSGILNNISTNVWLNTAFAVVFLVFALSFFGLFEIALPSSISYSVDSRSGI